MNKYTFFFASVFAGISFLITGCKKEADVNATQTLKLHVHNMAGTNKLNYTSTFTANSGRKYSLSSFRYYLSNFVLIKSDGSEVKLDKYLLVSPAVEDYELGKLPVGDYKGLRFAVGIDSATNHKDPTQYEPSNPLAIQSPAIHWSWNSGYIFFMAEGNCDTSAAKTGNLSHPLTIHVGTDELYRQLDFSTKSFKIETTAPKELVLDFDMNKALNTIDFAVDNETHTFINKSMATKIANNWASAFTID